MKTKNRYVIYGTLLAFIAVSSFAPIQSNALELTTPDISTYASNQYTVSFYDEYMRNTLMTKTVTEGSDITKFDMPIAMSYASDGIKFEGFIDENGNDCSNGIKNVTKNMTITAHYRPYRITAKFVTESGAEAHLDMNTAYRTKLSLPKYTGKVPEGKMFAFWQIKHLDGNTHLMHEGEEIDVPLIAKCPTDDEGTVTFTAVFTNIKTDNTNNSNANSNKNETNNSTSTNTNNENITPAVQNTGSTNNTNVHPTATSNQNTNNELVQTGINFLPVSLLAIAATSIAVITCKRRK